MATANASQPAYLFVDPTTKATIGTPQAAAAGSPTAATPAAGIAAQPNANQATLIAALLQATQAMQQTSQLINALGGSAQGIPGNSGLGVPSFSQMAGNPAQAGVAGVAGVPGAVGPQFGAPSVANMGVEQQLGVLMSMPPQEGVQSTFAYTNALNDTLAQLQRETVGMASPSGPLASSQNFLQGSGYNSLISDNMAYVKTLEAQRQAGGATA